MKNLYANISEKLFPTSFFVEFYRKNKTKFYCILITNKNIVIYNYNIYLFF